MGQVWDQGIIIYMQQTKDLHMPTSSDLLIQIHPTCGVLCKGIKLCCPCVSAVAKQPPPVCFSVPIGKGTKACIDFTNLYLDKDVFKACVQVTVTYNHIPFKLDLGCFTIPIHKLYQDYMAQELGVDHADTTVLEQWFRSLEKGQMMRRVEEALKEP